MKTQIRGTYITSADVLFDYDAATVDPFYYVEDGQKKWRLEGIYPGITTEEGIWDHLAYNALVNNVMDACRLDGWADLERGQLTMYIRDVEFDRA